MVNAEYYRRVDYTTYNDSTILHCTQRDYSTVHKFYKNFQSMSSNQPHCNINLKCSNFKIYEQYIFQWLIQRTYCEIWDSHSDADKDSSFLPCYAMLNAKCSTSLLIWHLIIPPSWYFSTWYKHSQDPKFHHEYLPVHILSMTLSWVIWTLLGSSNYFNGFRRSKDEKTKYCCQEATCNFKDSSELKLIRRSENREILRDVMASCNIGSSTVYDIKKQKDQLWSFMASSGSLKQPKLVHLDKVL